MILSERALGFKRDGVADGIYKIEGAGPLIGRGLHCDGLFDVARPSVRYERLVIYTCTASSFWFNVVVLDVEYFTVEMELIPGPHGPRGHREIAEGGGV